MTLKQIKVTMWVCAAVAGCLVLATGSLAEPPEDMGGWEINGTYNQHYNAAELDKIKATIVKVTEITPMPGMAPGVGLVVRERDSDEDIEVHVCPTWFMKPGETGLQRGNVVKIRGCWAEIDGRDVYMASKIKMGDYFSLKVRLTKDGTPFWSMSPEQLAYERASQ
jgi:hypothetical protein